ncbi:hypothetical protein HETIRDRAFT_171363 [Heterobasidion irregulare TC 32-1]|uniref:Uncharacterized protein n=1 Tax=Heterobasidion irregulare (strain TC 32-1) TaxID=747525 RepID=W4K522_HETIT|nr:uncharacterized protein HETIRDRAFT_171363 [Heterobasidion irregulare TC 32-1]ETW80146.1 hypothetical protein HETIRDRAFT_171363 [Heterobasidion irregulare TC 32-1]
MQPPGLAWDAWDAHIVRSCAFMLEEESTSRSPPWFTPLNFVSLSSQEAPVTADHFCIGSCESS